MRRDLLLHPVVVGSMLILAINDHWLKSAWPGWITGKLSDCAGLVFFPVMLGFIADLLAVNRKLLEELQLGERKRSLEFTPERLGSTQSSDASLPSKQHENLAR